MNNYNFAVFKEKEDYQKMSKIKSILDGENLIMFFKNHDRLFGAPETSRIIFAKMKSPEGDEDLPANWEDEANFMAYDLMKKLSGENAESIFSAKDMPDIKILDRDRVEKKLMSCPYDKASGIKIKNLDHVGMINLKDKNV